MREKEKEMKTWLTADLHFGHKNIMKFCPVTRARFNDDVDYMNNAMVEEWNAKVGPDDTVYILGDVAFMSGSDAGRMVNRLNGKKILVAGNHDRKTLLDETFRSAFVEVHQYLDIKYDGHKIVMFHYPIAEWDQMHRGSLHFHGHLHGGTSGLEPYRALDVAMDATGEIVISMERAINMIKDNVIKGHHQKDESNV
jgi:calcineurin-like phosphoesterase family protein